MSDRLAFAILVLGSIGIGVTCLVVEPWRPIDYAAAGFVWLAIALCIAGYA